MNVANWKHLNTFQKTRFYIVQNAVALKKVPSEFDLQFLLNTKKSLKAVIKLLDSL